jgi:hypothetical protein
MFLKPAFGAVIAIVIVTTCVALRQAEQVVVGQWSIVVLDMTGKPVAGQAVGREWHDYSHDLDGTSDLVTDGEGKVVFPSVVLRRSVLFWKAGGLLLPLRYGVHGSRGKNGRVSVQGANNTSIWCDASNCEHSRTDEIRLPEVRSNN